MEIHFAKVQEAARKDIERGFGVLKSRFAIVRGPSRFWEKNPQKHNDILCDSSQHDR